MRQNLAILCDSITMPEQFETEGDKYNMDFASELQRIQRLLQQNEYTPAATRCMIVTEQALRAVADLYLDEIDDAVKQNIHEAVRKRGKRQIDRLTMGQMVRVFEEAEFLEACARTADKNLSSLAIIDLKRLTNLRNKLIHEAQEASETEAQFLSLCLKVLLETFDLSVPQPKGPDTEPTDLLFRDGHALIIGVGADLPDTVNDANGMTNMLRDAERCAYPSDQVLVLTEAQADRTHILAALDNLARATDPESTALIYFSGHGYQASSGGGSRYYLMPYGYNVHALANTTISGAEFADKLKAIPAKKLLVLLDCCHAGGVGDAKAPDLHLAKKPLPPEVLPLLSEGRGRVLIASSRENELSYAGKPYSAFTVALLEALCGEGVTKQDGYVRVADLALHAREKVPGRTGDRQHPILHFEHADNFVLAYYAGGDTQPKALPFTVESTEIPANIPQHPSPHEQQQVPEPPIQNKNTQTINIGGNAGGNIFSSGDRNSNIIGNVSGGVIQTGDHSSAALTVQQAGSTAQNINIREEVAAIRQLLRSLISPDHKKIARAFEDIEDELNKAVPDRNEIGESLERALRVARKAENFSTITGSLTSHLQALCSWLGSERRINYKDFT